MSVFDGSTPVEPLVKTYPPVADSVAGARRALARLASACGAAAEEIDAIRLAVSEAMTHAVRQRGGGDGEIRVRAAIVDDGLAVSIEDDGPGPSSIPTGTELAPTMGLALIAYATDELAIANRPTGGTELRMRFALGSVSPQM